MVIRSAKPADLWPVKHLIEVLEETVFDEREFTAAFDAQLLDPHWHCFVCEAGGKIAALLNMRIDYQIHHAAKVAEILELVVEEDCRGQSIGRELFAHACEFAREEGCVQIELCSSMRRTDAHRFYEREGMRKDHFNFTMPL